MRAFKTLILLLVLTFPLAAFSQSGNTITRQSVGAPSGGCPFLMVDVSATDYYVCIANAWTKVTGQAGGNPGGLNGQIQYNNAGAFGGLTAITSTYVDNSIALTGTDINTSSQVTVTHLAVALPINQGGSGTTSTLTGLIRGSGTAMTAAEISADCTTSGSNAITCTQTSGVAFAPSATTDTTNATNISSGSLPPARFVGCSTSPKNETGADTAVLTCTPAAVAGVYECQIVLDVSAANTATLGWTATWTNSKGAAQVPTNMALMREGSAVVATTVAAPAGAVYYATVPLSVDNSGTNIVIKTTFTGTSITYNATAACVRLI